jgi:hypothetical protein
VRYKITKRNHYNPCFWTALWNEQFFSEHCRAETTHRTARDQTVFTLNLRSNKIFTTTANNVYFDKNLGIAEITPESLLQFSLRHYPDRHEELKGYISEHPESLYLDFEQTLTGVERLQGYDAIMRAVKLGGLESPAHKGFLACALVMHAMRSHELMSSVLEEPNYLGMDKWEYFWLLKNAWSNRLILARAVFPLALGEWTFWRTSLHCFPLCDSPVMIGRDSVMAILSPRLLLQIDLNASQPEDQWNIIDGISPTEFDEFRYRATANVFKDIVFSSRRALEQWQSLTEYRIRIESLATSESRSTCRREAAVRVRWALGGFGRVPEDFETWAGTLFDRKEVREQTESIRRNW